MFARPQAIPLAEDETNRFLPWIVAFMVYLAALALAGAMAASTVVARWDRELSGNLTVQVPPLAAVEGGDAGEATQAAIGGGDAGEAAEAAREAARLEEALAVLRATPGIVAAEALTRAEIDALLEPWLGAGLTSAELPLPRVVDVMLEPGAALDVDGLEAALAAAVPGASIDDHALWFERLASLARALELVAALILVLTGLAAALTVIYVTRSGLAVHRGVIELLHLIGARDGYIARQFQVQALNQGLKGGVPGLLVAAATLVMLGRAAGAIDVPLLPQIRLSPGQWAALAGVPVAAAMIAMVTARVTVLRTLRAMP